MKIEQTPNYCQVSIMPPAARPMEAIPDLKYMSQPFPANLVAPILFCF